MKIDKIPYIGGSIVLMIWMILINACQSDTSAKVASIDQLPEKIDFNFHVKPILSDRCFKCHGPDEKARKADLRFDVEVDVFAALDSLNERFAIVPGDLEKSQLIHRISTDDSDEKMPPPESNLSLSEYEVSLLKRWIEQGAEWKPHWAFIPPEKSALPKVSNPEWPQNSIDHFVLNRLDQEGLQPSKQASKEKLIRRLSFDLRGLPPSLKEIDAFLLDESTYAYEKLVDSFLAQDSYGERMAMEWLDVARYADSHGYQDDIERSMWPWRDWVIQAFNQNLPYDSFASYQIAGDLFPDATYEQKLATGFNRNHKITQEVGVIDEEYRVTYVLDRTNTFSTAFLGLTVECAQCHDHKYDPISQKEFYGLFSFFNNVPEKGRVDYGVEVAAPYLPLPQEKVEKISTYIEDLFAQQQNKQQAFAKSQWKKGFDTKNMDATSILATEPIPEGMVRWYPMDYIEENQIEEVIHKKSDQAIDDLIPIQGKFSGGAEFNGDNYASLESSTSFNFNQPFSISFWIKSLDGGIRGSVLTAQSEILGSNKKKASNFEFQVNSRKTLDILLANPRNKSSVRLLSKETVPENKWVHLALSYDGSRKAEGIKLFMDGKLLEEPYVLRDNLRGNIGSTNNLYLGASRPSILKKKDPSEVGTNSKGFQAGQLDELMLFDRELSNGEINQLYHYNPITDLLKKNEKNESDLKRLFYHQLLNQNRDYQGLTDRLREYKIRKARVHDIVLKPTMVMQDMDEVRPTFVLDRGQYDAPGDQVETGTPKVVLPFDTQQPKNRLGLAKWLFDPQNPLTARVAVNRYWQMIFGNGIVATPEDFGSQGALPSHPELLDFLAVELREFGWDIKKLMKSMVMSATYRQSVQSNSRLQKVDPNNVLLARGPQVRLPAEMIRDHALTISGLLSPQVGGPSVKPYQPDGLWLQVASGNQALRKYIQDHEQDLYRRSLYTFWKRTIPPPSMTVFDAPSREQCVLKRRPTSTPMQALVMLNDPQFIEASRLIGTRMLQEGGETAEERIRFAFRMATSRSPKSKEIQVLNNLLEQEKAEFEADPETARQFISIGEQPIDSDFDSVELAAYTVVANAMLNMTETIRK